MDLRSGVALMSRPVSASPRIAVTSEWVHLRKRGAVKEKRRLMNSEDMFPGRPEMVATTPGKSSADSEGYHRPPGKAVECRAQPCTRDRRRPGPGVGIVSNRLGRREAACAVDCWLSFLGAGLPIICTSHSTPVPKEESLRIRHCSPETMIDE